MDILKILKENSSDLYLTDLLFFKTELDLNNYSEEYKQECQELIDNLLKKFSTKTPKKEKLKNDSKESKLDLKKMSEIELSQKLNSLRSSKNHIDLFKGFLRNSVGLDEEFFISNINVFIEDEIQELIKIVQLSENSLEKYYSIFDKNIISSSQKFSEEFLIKHFPDLNIDFIKENKNIDWLAKDKISKKLELFLRLRGVKI